MKEKMLKVFKELYKGKRLLAVHLNGFSHTIIFDNGKTDDDIESEAYSLYTDIGNDKAKLFFEKTDLNHHYNFKHDPKEYVFVSPSDR